VGKDGSTNRMHVKKGNRRIEKKTQEPIHGLFSEKHIIKAKNRGVHQNILKILKTGIKSNAVLFIFLTT